MLGALENGGRKGIPKVGVVTSNGFSEDRDATKFVAQDAKDGINMFSVGIGYTDERELRDIASCPSQFVNVDSFEQLPTKLSKLVQLVCTSID